MYLSGAGCLQKFRLDGRWSAQRVQQNRGQILVLANIREN
jgi:hypothetical protein